MTIHDFLLFLPVRNSVLVYPHASGANLADLQPAPSFPKTRLPPRVCTSSAVIAQITLVHNIDVVRSSVIRLSGEVVPHITCAA